MRLSRVLGMILASGAILTGGCASDEIVHLSREPAMPETAVVEAAEYGPYYKNISIQDVEGAPEFLLFDGGGLVTTRPTHKQVLSIYDDDLDRANLLAPSRASSDYMLYVRLDDLRGPDVWIGSDKRASARITFHLVRWRTGEVVRQQQIEVAYVAQSPGVSAREVTAGAVGLAVAAGSGYGVTKLFDATKAFKALGRWHYHTAEIGGATDGAIYGVGAGEAALLLLNAGSLPRTASVPVSLNSEIGPADGTGRRFAALHGLLDLALDEFLRELSSDGSIVYKHAVGCAALNPYGYRFAALMETPTSYGVDCPKARFFASRLSRVYPANF